MSKTGFIYKIISPSKKFYIGRTINIKRRMEEHFKVSLISQEALRYGPENMKVEILKEIPISILESKKPFCTCSRERESYDYNKLIDIERNYIYDHAYPLEDGKNMLNILGNPLLGK